MVGDYVEYVGAKSLECGRECLETVRGSFFAQNWFCWILREWVPTSVGDPFSALTQAFVNQLDHGQCNAARQYLVHFISQSRAGFVVGGRRCCYETNHGGVPQKVDMRR